MHLMEDPPHPIIARPWEYEVVGLNFQQSDGPEPYLELTLQKGDVIRHLRFLSPQSLEIEEGFPMRTGGLYIADVSARGLDRITIRVDDFEASPGALRFWARTVIDLDKE